MFAILTIFTSLLLLNNNISAKKKVDLEGMVKIPSGYFLFGVNKKRIYLEEFYIDKEEMSAKLFSELMIPDTFGFTAGPAYCPELGSKLTFSNFRASCVHWREAKLACKKLGKRLPTAMEWEKAARGTDGRPFPWGDEKPTCEYAVMDEDGHEGCGTGSAQGPCTRPKGNSPYGICDMVGNVCEWVLSKKNEKHKDEHNCRGGSASYRADWLHIWDKQTLIKSHPGVRCAWSKTDYNLKLLPEK